MELFKRDSQIIKAEQEIKRKIQLLKQKGRQYNNNNNNNNNNNKDDNDKDDNDNEYLKNVHKRYMDFNASQTKEKQRELESFQTLERYLTHLIHANELDDEQKRIAIYDKKEITNKIEQIKQELQQELQQE